MRHHCLKNNFYTLPEFESFKKSLDFEMKYLKFEGAGLQRKRVELISFDEEKNLWRNFLLESSMLSNSGITVFATHPPAIAPHGEI